MVFKVHNKEGDIVLPASINAEVDPQDIYNKLPGLSVIPID